jgi:D-inositol-3-phosphate glycosyltransferase
LGFNSLPEKRVVIIGSSWPLRGGGLSTFNERLAWALQDAGYQVIIYTFSLQYPSFLFPGKNQLSEGAKPEGLNIKVKINSINPLNWFKVASEIKKIKADFIVVRYWIPFMAPCLGTISRLIKNNRTKVLAIVDNIIPHEKRPGDKILSRYFVNSVDGFLTMSAAVLKDLERFSEKKPKVFALHPLYDSYGQIISKTQARKELDLSQDERLLLFFGFIRDYKGLDLLLEAMADKRVKEIGVKLIVAGEFYTDSKPYLNIISENNLENAVLLHTEFIPNEKVAEYFCAVDMVVQPYKDATQSGVTQTAYYFNKPMLVTNVGGLSETIACGKVGYVVNPNSKEIADAIIDFYKNNKEAEFTKGAEQEKKKFSWEKFVNILEKLLDQVS